ncbi:hypothetical protein ABIB54_003450 [Frigoribacterium sp. UYMn621]
MRTKRLAAATQRITPTEEPTPAPARQEQESSNGGS